MKHRIVPLTLTILLFMSLLSGCSLARKIDAAEDNIEHRMDRMEDSIEHKLEQSVSQSVTPDSDRITQAQALEIALTHSGYTADQVQHEYTEYEIDDRIPHYDVRFYMENIEYEYEIHAESGEILSYDRD